MVKFLACAVILGGCSALGMLLAARFHKRVKQLSEFENAFVQLEYDIGFLNIPLDEAFDKLSKNTENIISDIFRYISYRLSKNKCCDMYKVWKRAIEHSSDDLYLSDSDKQILLDFSKTLGQGNSEKEKNNIKLTLMRLKIAQTEAQSAASSNVKMYRGLGVLMGIFIVILLF